MAALRVSVVACLLLASTFASALNIPSSPKNPPPVPRQSPFLKPIVGAGLQSERIYNIAHRGKAKKQRYWLHEVFFGSSFDT